MAVDLSLLDDELENEEKPPEDLRKLLLPGRYIRLKNGKAYVLIMKTQEPAEYADQKYTLPTGLYAVDNHGFFSARKWCYDSSLLRLDELIGDRGDSYFDIYEIYANSGLGLGVDRTLQNLSEDHLIWSRKRGMIYHD